MDCNEDVFQPTNSTPILCNGEFISTECVLTPVSIPYINIPVDASQLLINQNLALAIQNIINTPGTTPPYTKFVAFITQTGTANPTISEILENTTGMTFNMFRIGEGIYNLVRSAPSTDIKTFTKVFNYTEDNFISAVNTDTVTTRISTRHFDNGTKTMYYMDGIINLTKIELIIYN